MIGMSPAMASIPLEEEVQKVLVIHKAVLCYIFFNSVMFLTVGAPLKNHSWNSYRAMDKTHILYRRCF